MRAPVDVLVMLLAAVIAAYLLITLIAVGACLWHANTCTHVEWRYFLGEPLMALGAALACGLM